MKKIFIIMFALVSAVLFTQEYIEFNEFGWGQDMSRSKPTFIDIDNDGLLDMIVGEQEGNLNHYEQSGVGSTEFVLITTTFDNINVGEYSAPTFTDIDNDGLLDLIIGEFSGNLNHYEQQSIGSYEFVLIATNFNSIDVGIESAPTFVDIDNDGLLDMIVGEFSGNLNHYEQFSAGSNNFILITANFNSIDVGFRSAPSFIDFDEDGVLDMIVGEQDGNLNHYQQSTLNPNNFTLITSSFNDIDVGFKSIATFIDIDNNSLIDMIIGEQDGNLNHYEQISTDSDEFVIITPIFTYIDVGSNSIPTFDDIDNNGLLDMLIGNYDGYLIHYEQTAFGSDEFGLITTSFNNIDVGNSSAPILTDLNNDSLLDLIIGEYDGNINHYQQSSIGSNEFVLITTSFNAIDVGSYSTPSFTDIDNDVLLDLIIGEDSGYLYHYEQDAEGSFEFVLITTSFNDINIGSKSTPIFTDIDHNGLLDLIIGEDDGNLNHYEQTAFDSVEFNLITNSFRNINLESNSTPTFIDIDNDGWEDLFVGTINGGVHYYQIVPPDVILYADFVTLDTLVIIGQQVQFTDLSTADYTLITSWEWDFDFDGTIDSTGQTPGWTYFAPGDYTVSLTVSDGDFEDTETKVNYITVLNSPPFVQNPIDDFSFPEDTIDTSIDLNEVFDDPDIPFGDSLTFSYSGNEYIQIEIVDGNVTLTPDSDWFGSENIVFIATDLNIESAEDNVIITVSPLPDSIIVQDLSYAELIGEEWQPIDQDINEAETLNFFIDAYDPDGNDLEYSWQLDGNEVSTESSYDFVTDYTSAGDYVVTLDVTDNFRTRDELHYTWNVTVNDVDQEIVINDIQPPPGPVTIDEMESIDFMFSGYDPDGNPLDYSWELDGVGVSIDSTYLFTTDYTSAGFYSVTLFVTDNFTGRSDNTRNELNYSWTVTVNDVDQEIIVNDIQPVPGPVTIDEMETINFFIDAYDPDGNPLEYSWKLDGVEESTVSTYDFTTDYTSAGNYLVTLDVTDNFSDNSLYYEWNVTVNDIDQEIIVIDIQPTPGPVTIDEMDTINFFIDAYDPDGNPLEYSWKLDGVEESTSSAYDFITDYTSAGIYSVTLFVTDNFTGRSDNTRNELNYSWTVTVNDVDQPIVVNDIQPPPGPVTIDEMDTINFFIDAYDPDGNPLEYSWKLDGVEESTVSTYDFITDYTSAGLYLVTLDVTDNFTDNSIYYEWNVTVNDVDQPIVVNDIQPTPGPVTIDEMEKINFFIDAYDPDGNPLEYSWKLDGVEESTSNAYDFTTDYTSAGLYLVTLDVTDNFSDNSLYYEWNVTVNDVDQEIVVNDIQPTPGPVTINETETINFFIDAYDPDGNPLEYSWKLDGVEESTVSTYDFTTDYTSAGLYLVTLDVTDNFTDNSIYYEWNVTVNDVDQEIVVTDIQPTPGPVTIDEMETINFFIDAYDPDGNPLEYSWKLDGVEESTSSAYDFTTDYTSAGLYLVTLDVTDNFSDNSLYYEWNVTVNDVDQNIVVNNIQPPPGPITIDETETINFFIDAYDPDGNPLEYSWKLDGVEESTVSTYDFTTDYTSAGLYLVTLDVTDNFSDNSLYYEWNVTVNDVDQPIVVNNIQPPPGPVTINETETINFFIDAYDPDGNPLEYSWKLDGVEVSTISTYDFITDYTSAGLYLVTLDVTDNFTDNSIYYEWNVTVNDVDQNIVVNNIQPPPGPVTINETETINFFIDAYDPDGNPLEYSWKLDGVEESTVSTYNFITDYTSAGLYLVSLDVTDNFSDNSLYYEWNVTVNDVDQEIVVTDIQPAPGPVTIDEMETINFFIDAYDPDGNPLEYSWKLDGNEVSTISTYDFITDYTSAGLYLVTLDVTDNFTDNSIYYEWNVTVNDVDQEIVVNDIQPPPGPVTIDETETINFFIDAYDPDGNPLEYSWKLDGVEESTVSTYDFTTDYTSAGLYLVTLDVTDNFTDNSLYYEWNVTVNDVDQEIVVNDIQPTPGPVTIDEMDTIDFYFSGYDPDGNPLEFSWQLDGVEVSTDSTYIFETDYTSAGEYVVTLEVTDNFGTRRISSVSRNTLNYSWDVTVDDVDQPIVVNELIPPEGDITIDEGDVINFSIDAYDPDGNNLEYSWQVEGVEVSTTNSFDFITDENSAGEYEVTLFVTDNFGTRDELNFLWNVTVNDVSGSGEVLIPVITKLFQNHPNPFNPLTNIQFDIKENEMGVLSIFNLKGQIIESQRFNDGIHNYSWNAENQSSGVYFYKLQTESFTEIRKMILLK